MFFSSGKKEKRNLSCYLLENVLKNLGFFRQQDGMKNIILFQGSPKAILTRKFWNQVH